ncbi:protein phosphatase 2C domain-containing protein [Marinobacter pelagius]|uniref:PP2C family protein-serine/threonine phosphatase n=1 Tax=Marinobacter sp. C7 TaxID=2951363 RepID=UPI001EF0D21C|nr:protein phosphatase 2C domain-containing protein [Marinobacter sp. C7]MCG7201258.1 protein phosphatase 2C domain-containing protein [Marinobacter sp. C7]
MDYDIAGDSHVGSVRQSNQDRVEWRRSEDGRQALLVLADGMGGHQGGEIASQLAVASVLDSLLPSLSSYEVPEAATVRERLDAAFDLASMRIREEQGNDARLEKMGTTLLVAWIIDSTAFIGHIGDSRCYLISQAGPRCLTRDDTVVQNMIEDGSITEAEAPRVPFRNVLTRAVGASDDSMPSFRIQELAPGEGLLLCSDGLTGALPESHWPELIGSGPDAGDAVQALIEQSLENGAGDNVSVVLMMVKD